MYIYFFCLFQPVYLFLHLKRSQGKENTSKHCLKPSLSATLSINGEPVVVKDINEINIHDFTTFANEQALLPEFKSSIRLKPSLQKPSFDHLTDGSSGKRRSSFANIAKQVVCMEKVLLNWPRPRTRPKTRHHSSSSEDMNETESEEDSNENKIPVNYESASTTHSDLSPSSSQNTSPEKNITGGGSNTAAVVEHDDVLCVVSPNNLHEHEGFVRKYQDGSTVDESLENSTLMVNGEGRERNLESSGARRRLCPCPCVLL